MRISDWSSDVCSSDLLKRLQLGRESGKLADEVNRRLPGSSSLVKASARRLARNSDEDLAARGAELLLAADRKWADPRLWATLKVVGQVSTITNFLTALDLERTIGTGSEIQEIERASCRARVGQYG